MAIVLSRPTLTYLLQVMNADGAFAGPFEGEIVELFGKTASGGPRLMYDTRIAISNVTRDFCKNGGKPCRVTYTSDVSHHG